MLLFYWRYASCMTTEQWLFAGLQRYYYLLNLHDYFSSEGIPLGCLMRCCNLYLLNDYWDANYMYLTTDQSYTDETLWSVTCMARLDKPEIHPNFYPIFWRYTSWTATEMLLTCYLLKMYLLHDYWGATIYRARYRHIKNNIPLGWLLWLCYLLKVISLKWDAATCILKIYLWMASEVLTSICISVIVQEVYFH